MKTMAEKKEHTEKRIAQINKELDEMETAPITEKSRDMWISLTNELAWNIRWNTQLS